MKGQMDMQNTYRILSNRTLAKGIMRMTLSGDTSLITAPGQFVEIMLQGRFLRRPISVCDWDDGTLTLIYKVVGAGTAQMAGMRSGQRLDILTGLGNGFDMSQAGDAPLAVGGGVGVPPLYGLVRRLRAMEKDVDVIMGFNSASDVFYMEEMAALGARVFITTADGSLGLRGFVTDALRRSDRKYTQLYACGPIPMLRALCPAVGDTEGQLSLEERMGCGFGACMGCSVMVRDGARRVCKDGPVFRKSELIWQ